MLFRSRVRADTPSKAAASIVLNTGSSNVLVYISFIIVLLALTIAGVAENTRNEIYYSR